jgi:mono/diheme cytochrome c family protein
MQAGRAPFRLRKMKRWGLLAVAWGMVLCWGCSSEDMKTQPSFSFQEAPRRHSPQGSVPRSQTTFIPSHSQPDSRPHAQGKNLYAINCSHCHGPHGDGDGAAAGFLQRLPPNLHAPAVQQKSPSSLFQIITHGLDAMPAFRPYLSPTERWALVEFVRSLEPTDPVENTP